MNDTEQRKSAQAFADRWKDKGNEEQHKQDYWKELLNDVFGINEYGYLEFEKPVPMLEDGKKTTKFIDVYIPSVKALIEQKGIAFDLDTPEQRGKSKVTPFEQAKRYNDWLPHNEKARWLITSNSVTTTGFRIMRKHAGSLPVTLKLSVFTIQITLSQSPLKSSWQNCPTASMS